MTGIEKGRPLDWNVIVTVNEGEFRAARRLLGEWGDFVPTDFQNVLVARVEDPARFLHAFSERVAEQPGVLNVLARVVPATLTFDFQDPAEFKDRVRDMALRFVPELAGRCFHVRMHRRGFKGRLSSKDEEQRLDKIMLDALAARGTPGAITFDDPDFIIAIETVGQRAGVSLWSREELRHCRFLGLD